MARHITVDEAAKVLGTTDRTVRRMLNEGRLSGSQFVDKGKQVWRVHLTKELLQRMHEPLESSASEIVDAETTEVLGETVSSMQPTMTSKDRSVAQENQSQATDQAKVQSTQDITKTFADTLWSEIEGRFIGHLRAASEEIGQLKAELQESNSKLRLLEDRQHELKKVPALEQRAAAAEENMTLKAVEVEALKKQLAAVQAERESAIRAATESSIAKESLAIEVEKLRKEKEAEAAAVEAKFSALSKNMEELKRPWWKKLFSGDAQV